MFRKVLSSWTATGTLYSYWTSHFCRMLTFCQVLLFGSIWLQSTNFRLKSASFDMEVTQKHFRYTNKTLYLKHNEIETSPEKILPIVPFRGLLIGPGPRTLCGLTPTTSVDPPSRVTCFQLPRPFDAFLLDAILIETDPTKFCIHSTIRKHEA